MTCPICGAKCVCRRRGEGGMCCGCHKHTARAKRLGITVEVLRDAHEHKRRIGELTRGAHDPARA